MFSSNWIALVITLVISVSWLRLVDYLAHRGLFSSRISRKIIHIGTGPIFVFCWLLFPQNPSARYFAAVIPLGITLQFALVGFGVIKVVRFYITLYYINGKSGVVNDNVL